MRVGGYGRNVEGGTQQRVRRENAHQLQRKEQGGAQQNAESQHRDDGVVFQRAFLRYLVETEKKR